MNKILLLCCVLSVVLACPLLAAPQPPTTFDTYEGLPPGGRALAMGYAYSCAAQDLSGVYFNPATLSNVGQSSFFITYEAARQSDLSSNTVFLNEVLKTSNLIFIGMNADKGAFSWRPLANNSVTTVNGADWTTTTTKINEYMFSVYSKHDNTTYSGLNISYLTGRIAQAKVESNIPSTIIADGSGVTSDLGFLYKISQEFSVGLNLKNLAGFMWWDDFEKDQLPFTVRSGFAFNIARFSVFAFDWEKRYYLKTNGPKEYVHLGMEQALGSVLKAQLGMFGEGLNDRATTHITGGLSYDRNNYTLSIACEKYQVNATDVFRYLFSFNMPVGSASTAEEK